MLLNKSKILILEIFCAIAILKLKKLSFPLKISDFNPNLITDLLIMSEVRITTLQMGQTVFPYLSCHSQKMLKDYLKFSNANIRKRV